MSLSGMVTVSESTIARYRGCLLGLAVGDAVGTTLEFSTPGLFTPITDMVGGGPFALQPGQWTDDTSMALCLATSLVERGGFDAIDQLQRYCRWYREGYLSSTGRCFDIGNTVRSALETFERTGNPDAGPIDPRTAGNGSIMRLAPIPLAYAQRPDQAMIYAAASSRTTHGTPAAIDACRYLTALTIGALQGVDKETLLADSYCPIPDYWPQHPLVPEIDEIAAGSFKHRDPPDIVGSGYVIKSLEAALWAFYRSSSFEDGCLLAVNLGNDADTTGAVYGQLAGAFYGADQIPSHWREKLMNHDSIVALADQLLTLAQTLSS